MAKQTFTTGQVLTAAQMTSLQQTAMGGGSATAKTASYVLVAADAGTTVAMNAAGSTTITVNTGLFSAGDIVFIQNLGAGVCTITAGTATVNTSSSLALAQYEGGQLYFVSASSAIFFKSDGATASSGGMTLISTTTCSSTSVTLSSIPSTYKSLYIVAKNITFASGANGFRILPNNVNNSTDQSIVREGVASGTTNGVIRLSGGGSEMNNSTNNAWAVTINNYAASDSYKPFIFSGFCVNGSGTNRDIIGGGAFRSNTAISSLVFDIEGATFTGGTILFYGVN